MQVLVTNIERFATHDGPGIRTTVFLKGCPLHCPWCANPETQSLRPVLMHDARRCVGCGECERACAYGALCMESRFLWKDALCMRCGACVQACLREALWFEGELLDVEDIVALAVRDRAYYERSGGGITFSGGEPLMCREQILALVSAAKRARLTVAVETTGNIPQETIETVRPFVDHWLYDLKHIDDSRLHGVIGANGPRIKSNLIWLLKCCPERVNVRIPVVPGFNYEEETLHGMLDWLVSHGCTKVNLLPYHTLGKGKYERLGWDYTCSDSSLKDEDLLPYHEYALERGMESKIGA